MPERPLSGRHVAIVGAGLIGLCSAHYLVDRGARVTVLDRTAVGGGAARGNGGLLCWTTADPLPAPGVVSQTLRHVFSPKSAFVVQPRAAAEMAPFLIRFALRSSRTHYAEGLARLDLLNRHSEVLWDALAEEGIGTSFSREGKLRLFDTDSSASLDHGAYVEMTKRGFGHPPGDLLDIAQLRQLEPSIGPAVRAGYLVTDEAFVNPSQFVDQMHASLVGRGVHFVERDEVRAVGEDADGAWAECASGRVTADKVLIAAGARSRSLAARFGVQLWLKPGKGYSFSVPMKRPPTRVLYLNDVHCAATPLGERTRIAGTMEFDSSFDRLNRARIESLQSAAKSHIDGADWSGVRDVWVGPRPMTVDGVPAIGAISPRGKVTIATGHNMIGLSLAPATGSLVADLMSGQTGERSAELRAFRPTRFQFRAPTTRASHP